MSNRKSNTVGKKRLREILRIHKGSQAAVARKLEVSRTMMSLWLKGRCKSARLDQEVPNIVRDMGLLIDDEGKAAA